MFSITLSDKLNKQNSHTNKPLMSIERLADVLIALRCGSPRDDHRYALVRQGIGAEHHSAWFRQWGFAVDDSTQAATHPGVGDGERHNIIGVGEMPIACQ